MKVPNRSIVLGSIALALASLHSTSSMAEESAADRAGVFTHQVCPVTGVNLAARERPIKATYDGREVRFCSPKCPKEFEANLIANLERLDEAIMKAQSRLYPAGDCIVNGEPLPDEIDTATDFVYGNLLIRLSSAKCRERFNADPEKYLGELERRVMDQQLSDYPLEVCVVSGDKLNTKDAKPIDQVLGHRLIRFCILCDQYCAPKFRENPARFFRLIEIARTDPNFPPKSQPGFHTLEELQNESKSRASTNQK